MRPTHMKTENKSDKGLRFDGSNFQGFLSLTRHVTRMMTDYFTRDLSTFNTVKITESKKYICTERAWNTFDQIVHLE